MTLPESPADLSTPVKILGLIITCLLPFATISTIRAIQNHFDLKRLVSNGYRKLAFRKASRGNIDADFLRGIAELALLVLLLMAVFGWMAHSSPK